MDHAEIDDYLARYAQTLTRFDATAAAELWAEPGVIVDDRFSGVLDDRTSMARGLEQSYPLYRALGLSTVDYELLSSTSLTGAIALLHVRWLFLDADGAPLTDLQDATMSDVQRRRRARSSRHLRPYGSRHSGPCHRYVVFC